MAKYAVADGYARFNVTWYEFLYSQYGDGTVAVFDNILEHPPADIVYVTDLPIDDAWPDATAFDAHDFVAFYDAGLYTSEQPRTYRPTAITDYFMGGDQQVISLTTPSVITNNYKTRWKFRTSSIDRPLEYQNIMIRQFPYMRDTYYTGIYYYFRRSSSAWGEPIYWNTQEEFAYLGGYTNGDEWFIRFDGSGQAMLIGQPFEGWGGGVGAAIYADRDEKPFAIQADTWYIMDYEADDLDDPDGLGGYARFTLTLADGDVPGDAVAEVIYQRLPPSVSHMVYGDGVVEDDQLYAPGAHFTEAPSEAIIINGYDLRIVVAYDDEHLIFYSSAVPPLDLGLIAGEVEWSIPGQGPETTGIQSNATLFSDPLTVDWDWVQVCVGEESIIYPGSVSSGGVTYISEDPAQTGVYITAYPYHPGTLKLSDQGTLLRPGSDFVEMDPENGTFRVFFSQDLSSTLTASYTRYGDEIIGSTGGNVYRPPIILQYGWGTRFDGYNCTMACSAMALARHTNGAIISTPPEHRANQDDQVGGADLLDVQVAWARGWNQSFTYTVSDWGTLEQRLNEGRGVILQGDYGALPADKRFSASFTGGHAIYLNEQFSNGTIWGADPLYKYPCIYTTEELISYAHSLAIGGEYGRVSFGYTRVTT